MRRKLAPSQWSRSGVACNNRRYYAPTSRPDPLPQRTGPSAVSPDTSRRCARQTARSGTRPLRHRRAPGKGEQQRQVAVDPLFSRTSAARMPSHVDASLIRMRDLSIPVLVELHRARAFPDRMRGGHPLRSTRAPECFSEFPHQN